MGARVTNCLEWAVAERPLPGQALSGDGYAVVARGTGVLVAIIDGLGHGQEAWEATQCALEIINRVPDGSDPLTVLARCHQGLSRTRGAVMSLALLDRELERLTWVGVGNVEGVLLTRDAAADEVRRNRLFLKGGVVGQNVPAPRATSVPLRAGDTLLFATDGFPGDLGERAPQRLQQEVEMTVGELLGEARETDDALVFCGRYRP